MVLPLFWQPSRPPPASEDWRKRARSGEVLYGENHRLVQEYEAKREAKKARKERSEAAAAAEAERQRAEEAEKAAREAEKTVRAAHARVPSTPPPPPHPSAGVSRGTRG